MNCVNCGDNSEHTVFDRPYCSVGCFESDYVKTEDLRELVEEWRDRELHPHATEKERIMWGTAIKELEAVLEE